MKTCIKCKKYKHLSDFFKNKSTKDGYTVYCKPCFNLNTKAAKNLKRYGMSTEEITKLKETGCELCGVKNNLHVDHNHRTGSFRGILCTNCNRGIGHLKDSPDLLRKAIAYLESKGNYSTWQS
jgi:hypothetical protein